MGAVRRPWWRILTVLALAGLVVARAGDRDAWFWVGCVLLVVNLAGLVTTRHAGAGAGAGAGTVRGRADVRLAELRGVPGLAAALAVGPDPWRQVSYLDHETFAPLPVAELVRFVWITRDDEGWSIGLADEAKPYVDLDVPEDDDPVVAVLTAHPSVAEAWHEDREVYRVVERSPLSLEEFTVLAAQALVAHHRDAVERLSASEG